ncbi:glycosyltransferase family 2 protein [Butyrivibrio sp. AC2005]|uniref:glycosyltransferase family 2 protein n=1 Tax=Butyrivibrio sp. AC2005 TaxID=1280672 RepID=UPI0003FF6A7F|nr:glycosyltransferase [Butyrivibrio sp. AC2005]
MNKTISTIIPFYNSALTLPRMLDSILSGTVLPSEIILINDGSTDDSSHIAAQYADMHSIIKLVNQPHSGVSAARNRGLKIASSEFISFLDADDFIEPDMYSELLAAITDESIDGCICGYFTEKDRVTTSFFSSSISLYSSSVLLEAMFTDENIRGFLFNRLFRADIIKNYEFNKNIDICEDLLFQAELYTNNNNLKFACINKPLYHYVQSDSNATNSLNLYEGLVFKYEPSFVLLQKLVNKQYVIDCYDSILCYSMYCLLKAYKTGNKTVLPQIKMLQKDIKAVKPSSVSKRRIIYIYAPLLFSHFLK